MNTIVYIVVGCIGGTIFEVFDNHEAAQAFVDASPYNVKVVPKRVLSQVMEERT